MEAYTYIVEGRGEFPVDMLRRDRSVPVTPRDVDLAATAWDSPEPRTEDGRRALYQVTLRTDERQAPNTARWESFGFRVVAVGPALFGPVSEPRQQGRPRVHPEGTSDSERAALSDERLKSAGGGRRTLRLSAAGVDALLAIRATGIDASDTDLFERLLIEEQSRINSPSP